MKYHQSSLGLRVIDSSRLDAVATISIPGEVVNTTLAGTPSNSGVTPKPAEEASAKDAGEYIDHLVDSVVEYCFRMELEDSCPGSMLTFDLLDDLKRKEVPAITCDWDTLVATSGVSYGPFKPALDSSKAFLSDLINETMGEDNYLGRDRCSKRVRAEGAMPQDEVLVLAADRCWSFLLNKHDHPMLERVREDGGQARHHYETETFEPEPYVISHLLRTIWETPAAVTARGKLFPKSFDVSKADNYIYIR